MEGKTTRAGETGRPAARPAAKAPRAPHERSLAMALGLVRAKPLHLWTEAEIAAWKAEREARIERWRRPLRTRWDRVRAWANMLVVDHGAIRLVYPNRWRLGDHAWRMAQPLPHHIRRFARAGGRSVVSLRGGQTFGSLPLEIEACAKAGLEFHTIVLRSRRLPGRAELLEAVATMKRLPRPVLFHCKSGADRAGFVSALWLAIVEGRAVAEARRQLGLRYGHVREGKTGVLDAFFDAYEAETAPGGPAEGMDLEAWIAARYEPKAIEAGFRSKPWANLLTDRILARE